LYNPAAIALTGILAWLFFWIVTPVYATGTIDPSALAYIAACYVGFFLGCFAHTVSGQKSRAVPPASSWNLPFPKGMFWISVLFGLVGMGLRFYDRAVLRGADYSNALDLRDTLTQVAAGPVSIAGAILLPFCFIPLVALLVSRFRPSQLGLYLISILVFFLPAIESLAQLSRSIMLTTLALGFAAVVCTRFRGSVFNRKLALVTAGGILIMLIASTFVFTNRLDLSDRTLSSSVVLSVYADNLQPTETAWRGLVSGSPIESTFYSTILSNGMYYISGAFEFSTLWTRPDEQPFTYGAFNGIAYVRALQIVLAPGSEALFDEANVVYKVGVFQTFFGGAWVDFGYFGPVFLFLFGYVSRMTAMMARAGNVAILPIYLYLAIVIFFMPVTNFINGGLGNYIIASFLIIPVIFKNRLGTSRRDRAMSPASATP
jgi:oligosaccharide repeat unit polymerase